MLAVVGRDPGDRRTPPRWTSAGPDLTAVSTTIDQIAAERAASADAMSVALLRHLPTVLLLRIDRLPTEDDRRVDSATAELFTRFQAELERSYAITRSTEHYAARLGYTVKHLTRACVAAAGHPARHLIDARVVLEPKACSPTPRSPSQRSAAASASRTRPTSASFPLATPTHTQTTPGAFRRIQKASGWSRPLVIGGSEEPTRVTFPQPTLPLLPNGSQHSRPVRALARSVGPE
ncbi:hypothetical protein [Nonomuraea sp. NPDC050786]|uniref:hypothetical protein n=1 Tax=Nonomuraea sp. NPDC050786 TaxID=3154840 RepID=UPI003402F4E6